MSNCFADGITGCNTKGNDMQMIFIGNRFYRESQTRMSSYYAIRHDGSWERCAIGDIENALAAGETVTIRPANRKELEQAERMLTRLS
jgi:hypothetical protein